MIVRNSLNNSLVEGCVVTWNYNINLNGSSVSTRTAATDEFGKCTVAVALAASLDSVVTIEVEVTLTRDGYAPLTTVT